MARYRRLAAEWRPCAALSSERECCSGWEHQLGSRRAPSPAGSRRSIGKARARPARSAARCQSPPEHRAPFRQTDPRVVSGELTPSGRTRHTLSALRPSRQPRQRAQVGQRTVSTHELTYVQARERLAPDLPPAPGKVARREFEYKRHSTLSFMINFDVATGRVCARRMDHSDRCRLRWSCSSDGCK